MRIIEAIVPLDHFDGQRQLMKSPFVEDIPGYTSIQVGMPSGYRIEWVKIR